MGLFGLIKTVGEEVSVGVREWLGTDYLLGALSTAGGAISAAYFGEFIPTALRVPDKWYLAVKSLTKVGLSWLYYFLGKKANAPLVGLTASLGSITSLVIDVVEYFTKTTPAEAGRVAALQIAGTWAAAVRAPPAPPAAPPKPALKII